MKKNRKMKKEKKFKKTKLKHGEQFQTQSPKWFQRVKTFFFFSNDTFHRSMLFTEKDFNTVSVSWVLLFGFLFPYVQHSRKFEAENHFDKSLLN